MQYGKIQIWSIQKALTNRNQKDSSTKILSLTLRFCRFPLWSNVFISKFVAALKATEFKPFTLVILLYFLHPTIKWFPFHLSLLFSSAFFLCQARLWGFFWPFSFLFFFREPCRAEHESDFLDRLRCPRHLLNLCTAMMDSRVTTRFLPETCLYWEGA